MCNNLRQAKTMIYHILKIKFAWQSRKAWRATIVINRVCCGRSIFHLFLLQYLLKMTSFIHEDGLGNMIDEDGKDIIMMESDSHLFPVEMIMDYDQYMDLKPPERMAIMKTESDEEELNEPMTPNRKSYRYHKNVEKEELFFWCTRKVCQCELRPCNCRSNHEQRNIGFSGIKKNQQI